MLAIMKDYAEQAELTGIRPNPDEMFQTKRIA